MIRISLYLSGVFHLLCPPLTFQLFLLAKAGPLDAQPVLPEAGLTKEASLDLLLCLFRSFVGVFFAVLLEARVQEKGVQETQVLRSWVILWVKMRSGWRLRGPIVILIVITLLMTQPFFW